MMKNRKRLNFLISGGALSGNKGAMAMTLVTIDQLRKMYPGCCVRVLSKYPAQDMNYSKKINIELVPSPPAKVVTLTAFFAMLICLLRSLLPTNWMQDSIIRAYRDADLILDVSGITFSDDHEWRGLALSVGWMLPAIATHRPVVKLSQAIGPFRRCFTRFWAKALLKRCPIIITRGKATEQNVRQLLPDSSGIYRQDDIAFLLNPEKTEVIQEYLASKQFPVKGFVGISPSAVVDRKARRKGIQGEYRNSVKTLIQHVHQKWNLPVVLIPHAWPQMKNGSEDKELCIELCEQINNNQQVFIIEDDLDCRILKGIIAQSELFIACRFHSMIASLGSFVPTMVIGWGLKYNEIMEQFGLLDFCIDFSQTDSQILCDKLDCLYEKRGQYQQSIKRELPAIINSSQQNFSLVWEYIDRYVTK